MGGRPAIVAPGGKIQTEANELLCQQGHQEFSVEPGAGTLVVVLGQMPHRQKTFEALEDQLNLPSETIVLQHLGGTHLGLRQGGDHHYVAGVLARFRPGFLLVLLFPTGQAPFGHGDGVLGFPEDTQTSGQALISMTYSDRLLDDLPAAAEPSKQAHQSQAFPRSTKYRRNRGIEADITSAPCRTSPATPAAC